MAARLSRTGALCVGLTVCAAPPPTGTLSHYAAGMHARWEASSAGEGLTINEVRKAEERQAMRTLGLQAEWLDVPDAPYRQSSSGKHFYNSDEELLGRVAAEERHELVPRITEEIVRMSTRMGARGRVRVFAPLGVGRHVDHQLVFWAARRLGPRYGVLFYEDYPYASREGALQARLEELHLTAQQPRVVAISELIGVKIAAIARYKSQLDVLFGSAGAMPQAVRAYCASVAAASDGVQYAERFWYIPPAYTVVM